MHPIFQAYSNQVDEVAGTMVRLCFSLPGQRNVLGTLVQSAGIPLDTSVSSASFAADGDGVIHSATAEQQMEALMDGGHDEVLVGNMCAVFLYSLWEGHYRREFAAARNVEVNSISSDFFAELAAYRHVIVHNRAKGNSRTEGLRLLPSVAKDQPVKVTRHGFEALVAMLKRELSVLSYPTRVSQRDNS